MKNFTIPGYTADAALELGTAHYRTLVRGMSADSDRIIPEWWGGDFLDWIAGKIDDAVDWAGGEVCGNCNTIGAGVGVACGYGTDGLGVAGGTCGALAAATAFGCNVACGK
jgi:hypothetical protein